VTALPHVLLGRDVWRGLTAFVSTFAAVLRQKWETSLMDDSLLRERGMKLAKAKLGTVTEAAKGAVTREGIGRMKHIDIHCQWLNEKVLRNEIEIGVIKGVRNPAVLLTKAVDKTCLVRHREALGWVQWRDMNGGVDKKVNFQNLQSSSTRAVFFVPAARKIWQHCITVGAIIALTLSSARAESNMSVSSTACIAAPVQSAIESSWQLFAVIVLIIFLITIGPRPSCIRRCGYCGCTFYAEHRRQMRCPRCGNRVSQPSVPEPDSEPEEM
jgi:hypothetical protein